MIDIDLSDPAILALHPHGTLSESDFETLTQAVDSHINETDRVPNLVIILDRLPHWDSLGAMLRHLQFVRRHQKVIAKLAIVGDVPLLVHRAGNRQSLRQGAGPPLPRRQA